MRRMLILLCVVALPVIFLLAGCGGGGPQAGKQHHGHKSHGTTLALHPEDDSGVRGAATFEDVSKGVLVKLQLRGLPKPDTLYLAHIHPGTCAEEGGGQAGESTEEHGHSHHEHGSSEEIEYPLSPLYPNDKGEGSSTTVLHDVTLEVLLSCEPMHANVHRPGPGEPPPVACADLDEAR